MRVEDRRPERVRSRSVADLMVLMLDQKQETARDARPKRAFRPFGFGRKRNAKDTPETGRGAP